MKKTFIPVLFFLLFCSMVSAAEQRFSIPIGDSPSKGPKDAPVTIIEFLDFQ